MALWVYEEDRTGRHCAFVEKESRATRGEDDSENPNDSENYNDSEN